MGESPALSEWGTPKRQVPAAGRWAQLRARLPVRGASPLDPPGAGSRETGRVGAPPNARILPQAGVHLALVGPRLPVAPVFFVHELVLVVLVYVHLPEPGRRHRVLRHLRSGAVAKASSWCCLCLSKPSQTGTRSLVPSLPSSALGRRRQPRLRRFRACALAPLLPPQVHTRLQPPTPPLLLPAGARARLGARWTQCAGADSPQEKVGRGHGGGGGRGRSMREGRKRRRGHRQKAIGRPSASRDPRGFP